MYNEKRLHISGASSQILIITERYTAFSCSLFVHYYLKKAWNNTIIQNANNCLKWRYIYVFWMFIKSSKTHWGCSIPVRVTSVRTRKQRNIAVSEFCFLCENAICSLFVLYFKKRRFSEPEVIHLPAPFYCLKNQVLHWLLRKLSPVLLPTYDSRYYLL